MYLERGFYQMWCAVYSILCRIRHLYSRNRLACAAFIIYILVVRAVIGNPRSSNLIQVTPWNPDKTG